MRSVYSLLRSREHQRTLGTRLPVLARIASSIASSSYLLFFTITSQASYSPAFWTASVSSPSPAAPLTPHNPSPWPSRPTMRLSFSLVARSTLPSFSLVFLAWISVLGTTLPLSAGTDERAARIWSDFRGLLKLAPLRRRAAAGAALASREWRTVEDPTVSISNSGASAAEASAVSEEDGAAFLELARPARFCLGAAGMAEAELYECSCPDQNSRLVDEKR